LDILVQAIQAIQRNVPSLTLYLAITVSANVVALLVGSRIGDPEQASYGKGVLLLSEMGLDAFLVFCYAAAQAVAFSQLGKEIDRPLWKIADYREALRRYFPLWMALNGAVIVLNLLAFVVPPLIDNEEFGRLPFWLLVFASATYIPVGAAIMFCRKFEWRKPGEALAPLRRQFPKTLIVLCLNGLLFFFFLSLMVQTASQKWIRPIIDIIFGYFDCVVFSATWLICMLDRQAPEKVDLDF